MEHPTNIPDLIAAIETEHQRLADAFTHLSDEQMTAPLLAGGWSVKDALAHVTFWERRMLYGLRPVAEGGTDRSRVPPEVADIPRSENWTDQVNERIYAQSRERSLPEVLNEFDQSYQQVLERITSLLPEDIFGGGTVKADENPALGIIADNTYNHYQEHAEAIRIAFS